jgi:hypothetical protein
MAHEPGQEARLHHPTTTHAAKEKFMGGIKETMGTVLFSEGLKEKGREQKRAGDAEALVAGSGKKHYDPALARKGVGIQHKHMGPNPKKFTEGPCAGCKDGTCTIGHDYDAALVHSVTQGHCSCVGHPHVRSCEYCTGMQKKKTATMPASRGVAAPVAATATAATVATHHDSHHKHHQTSHEPAVCASCAKNSNFHHEHKEHHHRIHLKEEHARHKPGVPHPGCNLCLEAVEAERRSNLAMVRELDHEDKHDIKHHHEMGKGSKTPACDAAYHTEAAMRGIHMCDRCRLPL